MWSAGLDEPMFADRHDAGRRLADRLIGFKNQNPVVLALPRGGVAVGVEIAIALKAPLDLVLVRKIGVPWQPELALGAVVDGSNPEFVTNAELLESLQLPEGYVEEESAKQLKEIERRRQLYLRGRPQVDVAGRAAIIVDDGIATGATARAALRAVRRKHPARLILAVPVAPPETVESLRGEADEVICLEMPPYFAAIGAFYNDFHQIGDEEVTKLLDRAGSAIGAAKRQTEG
jgi:putative phosphoribosyl transferase